MVDGLAKAHSIHVIAIDRPTSGGSTPVPLAQRVLWTHESLLAVHAALDLPPTFSILSHSNGIIYTLYTMLNLPPHLHVASWALSSPWVPPWISHSIPFGAARYIPAAATSNLGSLINTVFAIAGPIANLGSWSSGVVRGDLASTDHPAKERAAFLVKNDAKPADKQQFGRKYFSQKTQDLGFLFAKAEGFDAMGIEALVCLRKGDGEQWGWGMDGEERDLNGLYRRGFKKLKESMAAGRPTRMRVWYGTSDGMVPTAGRKHLRRVLVDELALVKDEEWIEIKGAAHDDSMGLSCVMDAVFGDVANLASQN